jgi:hypothetical protein
MSKKLIMKVSFDNFIHFTNVTLKINYQFNDMT